MPKVIKGAGRTVIYKVKRACEAERDNKGPIIPFAKVRARVAFLTGVSERTVTKITNEGNAAMTSSSKISTPGKTRNRINLATADDFEKCAIRHMIHSFYIDKKKMPSVNKLWMELKSDIDIKFSRTSLRRILKSMGYAYKNCKPKGKALLERTDIAAWRARYLLKLRQNKLEEQRPVIYISETHMYDSYNPQKLMLDEKAGILTVDNSGSKWTIAHAGGKNGFVKDSLLIFKPSLKASHSHDGLTSEIFLRWMGEAVIPNLPPNSLVVIDNAPHHCTQLNKHPTISNLKSELQVWLALNNVPYEDCWTKPQLYEQVKKHKGDPIYEIDNLLSEQGHEVLRLPPFHCDLNPMESIWDIVKGRIEENIVNESESDMVQITNDACNSVTKKEWFNACTHVELIEDKYYESDRLLDIELEKIIFNSDSESSEESDDDTMSECDDSSEDDIET